MRLIDLSKVIKEIERFKGYLDDDMILRIKIAINRLPIIDAEPVIRCKDCEYYNGDEKYCVNDIFAKPNGYCLYGEKK